MPNFEVVSEYTPAGDQPRAIAELSDGVHRGDRHQVLLGVTGSGKTFTIANVIAAAQRPTIVIAHNKTLAAQLYGEFKQLFPHNAVEYFVSYYDYYQPEAYVPSSDTYIEKDSHINEEIERMRHSATHSLRTRNDVVIVASVSCIYGLGTARSYVEMAIKLEVGASVGRDAVLRQLVECQYERNDLDFHRGTFRVRGDTVEVFPVYEDDRAIRIEFFGDQIERLSEFDPLRGVRHGDVEKISIFPGSHYVTSPDDRRRATTAISDELGERLAVFRAEGKLLEAQRLEQRTMFDLELIDQLGFCPGIENYSRHLSGRAPGEAPPCLLDYFPSDFLVVVDESHQTIAQIGAMYRGDRSRKTTLVDFGFRLPSALDNRPLQFHEWEKLAQQVICVSATPAAWEIEKSHGVVVEQVIRPTGLVDPQIEVRQVSTQVDDLLHEIRTEVAVGNRVLVTTLTKRMAEDLTEYYTEVGVRVRYLHADIDAIERTAIIRDLRRGEFDVLVGINLLREGLDIPETALVAILDADREGYLRSHTSLIQTSGRAARHLNGRVIMYAGTTTRSMKLAIDETSRRREIQRRHNEVHGIVPKQVTRVISDLSQIIYGHEDIDASKPSAAEALISAGEMRELIAKTTRAMTDLAEAMEYEKAAIERDRLIVLREMEMGVRAPLRALIATDPQSSTKRTSGRKAQPQKYRRKR